MNFNAILGILLEANIYNKQDFITSIDDMLDASGVSDNVHISNWFKKQFVNWYLSNNNTDTDLTDEFIPHEWIEGEPEWAKKEDIVDFKGFGVQTMHNIVHTIDYFKSLPDRELQKIYKETYEVIQQKVLDWDEQLKKNMGRAITQDDKGNVQTVYKWSNGFRFVMLLSKRAYDAEGSAMGHCVGSANYYDSTTTTIYSLRDSKNEPHVTLEIVRGNEVHQIKGKENRPPISKYIPYIKEFIISKKLKVVGDGAGIGMVSWEDQFYFPDGEEWEKLYNNIIVPAQNERIESYISGIVDNIINVDIHLNSLFLKELPDFLSGIELHGDLFCGGNQLTSLKNLPEVIDGNFDCGYNQLTSLEGMSQFISGHITVSNNRLTNLKGSPKICKKSFHCNDNMLTTLEGAPEEVIGSSFDCTNNFLTSLQHGPHTIGANYYCSDNKLTTLEGAPRVVNSTFDCSHNKLTNLLGGPRAVKYDYFAMNNEITSLAGAPTYVGRRLYLDKNPIYKPGMNETRYGSRVDVPSDWEMYR